MIKYKRLPFPNVYVGKNKNHDNLQTPFIDMLPGAIFSKTAVSAGRIFKNSGRKQEIPVSKKSIKRVTVAGCL